MLETHKRRQIILSLLRESGMLDVDEVAARLVVSPNTIRNDFNALAAEGLLRRIRGGAALAEPTNGEHGASSPPFLARCAINHAAKERMARWASDLIEDGDSIVLDASSTVYHLADFLMDRRNLTIVTNGIEVGRKLAQNPTNTVMLLGGLLRGDGVPTTDVLSDPILKDLPRQTGVRLMQGFYTGGRPDRGRHPGRATQSQDGRGRRLGHRADRCQQVRQGRPGAFRPRRSNRPHLHRQQCVARVDRAVAKRLCSS